MCYVLLLVGAGFVFVGLVLLVCWFLVGLLDVGVCGCDLIVLIIFILFVIFRMFVLCLCVFFDGVFVVICFVY